MMLLQENGEAVEVGEGILRPFNLHVLRQGSNWLDPQVSSQRTTLSLGTTPARSARDARRSSSASCSETSPSGEISEAANSASSSETLIPISAERACNASAVAS